MAMKRTIDFHLNEHRKKDNLYRAMKNDVNKSFAILDNGSSTDEEPMNLSVDLYPLSHYVNDPEQLIHQLFSVVHGKRLSRLIPPELKHMSFEELKADCLIQLLCMSKKRILATLEGKDMNSSSDSDDSIDNQRKQILEAEKKDEIARKRSHKEKKTKVSKKKKVETESESEREKSEEKDGKTLLEILELEMKAKAIRALLGPNLNDNNIQVEEAIKNEIIQEKTEEKNSVDKSNDDKNWNERYEEREDVKEVVKTSKLCTSMRRRMLLHQQKMLADRAKLKAAEAEKIKSEDTIKSKLDEKLLIVYSKNDKEQLNVNLPQYNSNDISEKLSSHHETIENSINMTHTIEQVNENDVSKSNFEKTTDSDEHKITSNTQESTDDDSQKSTDFERVLSEYTQKNTDLEKTINEYSKKNTDLKEEINKCSMRNDDMENTMNRCAQKNSDIETAINNFSATNDGVDETISKNSEKNSTLDTSTGESSKTNTDCDLNTSQNSKKKYVDLKAIVKEYSKRNTDIMALMKEYSQNNVDIQSVIGDYSDGNLKLETIIDEYSLRNSKIKTMIDEYSFNNTNVEKIIDRNNRKQLLIDKCEVESAAGKANNENNLNEKIEEANTICDLKNSCHLVTEINSQVVMKSANEEDMKNSAVN